MKFSFASILVVPACASKCTGSADPVVTEKSCYHGAAGALGLKETVDVVIRDFANAAGHVDVSGGGIEAFTCSNKAVTKSGQDIARDALKDCLPSAIELTVLQYCSDQDEIKVTVKDKSVPLPISTQLKKVACGSAQTSAADQMWSDFVAQHAQNGDGARDVFEANVKYIIEQNRKDEGVFLAVNQFAAMTPEEFKDSMLGYKKPQSDAPTVGVHKYSGADLPDSIDWIAKGAVTPVKNQGQCGSCWAFSTIGSMEGRAQISRGKLVSMSEQELVDCDKVDSGCGGGLMDQGFQYIEQNGVCTEDSYGYKGVAGSCARDTCTQTVKAGEITGHKDVDATEEALMEAVAEGPVSVAVEADTIFQFYHSGVMTHMCGAKLDHGVLVVGYGVDSGTKYWKVRNSWGASWGEAGYLRMKKGKGSKGQCGILSGPPSYPVFGSTVAV